MTERDLQGAVVQMAKALGYLVYHDHDSRGNEPGLPDLIMVHAGQRRCLAVELKTASGRLRDEQRAWAQALGAVRDEWGQPEYWLWRPGDWSSGLIERVLRGGS